MPTIGGKRLFEKGKGMEQQAQVEPTFSGWRKVFWPIQNSELSRVLPMALMIGGIIFTYSLFRDVKDALIVTHCGAEAIPFLKLYGTLPFAFLFMAFYGYLGDRVSKRALFRGWIVGFTLFFLAFGFILYPMSDSLHASSTTFNAWQEAFPRIQYMVSLAAHWTYALFYVMAELWGTIAFVLFWQFTNDTTNLREAKRFYPLLILVGNLGFFLEGLFVFFISKQAGESHANSTFGTNLKWSVLAMALSSALILYLYKWMHKKFPEIKNLTNKQVKKTTEGKTVKPSLMTSFSVVFKSPYLMLMLVLVLSYGITINLVEVTWKAQLKEQFPSAAGYFHFMGSFSMVFSIVTGIAMLFGSYLLRKLGWFLSAIGTPFIMCVTGIVFFLCIIFRESLAPFFAFFGLTPLLVSIFAGAAQVILTKSFKYFLFDSTKEMAYIPLSPDLRLKGKAVVDGIGDRLGKSGVGVIQQVLLASIVGATQLVIAPYLGLIFIIVVFAWLWAVVALNKRFRAISKD